MTDVWEGQALSGQAGHNRDDQPNHGGADHHVCEPPKTLGVRKIPAGTKNGADQGGNDVLLGKRNQCDCIAQRLDHDEIPLFTSLWCLMVSMIAAVLSPVVGTIMGTTMPFDSFLWLIGAMIASYVVVGTLHIALVSIEYGIGALRNGGPSFFRDTLRDRRVGAMFLPHHLRVPLAVLATGFATVPDLTVGVPAMLGAYVGMGSALSDLGDWLERSAASAGGRA